MIFPKFIVVACTSCSTPGPIFQNMPKWLLLEIEGFSCLRQKPRQRTLVYMPIQTHLSKPALPLFLFSL